MKSETCASPWQQDITQTGRLLTRIATLPLSSRKLFSISSPYIHPHFTTPCNVRTWGLMTCKIRVVTELVLQPAGSSFTMKGSFLLQQHPLACYSRIGNEKFVRSMCKIPIVLRKSLQKYPGKSPANNPQFGTECTT
jgi:hypothetical protein